MKIAARLPRCGDVIIRSENRVTRLTRILARLTRF